MMFEKLDKFSEKFPEFNLKSKKLRKKYLSMSIFLSFIISFFFFILFLFIDAIVSPAVFLISFAIVFFLLIKLPDIEEGKKNSQIEAELPFLMRRLGLLLDMKISFQRALKIVSEDDGVAAESLRGIVDDIEMGASPIKSLSVFAEKTGSVSVKRAIAQLMAVYEHGGKGSEIKRIGDELLMMQQHRMKDYASKSALFGLIFIAVSAILPTLLVIFATIGEFAFDMNIDNVTFFLGFFVFIPLMSILILIISKASVPAYAFSKEKKMNFSALGVGVLFFITSFFPGPPFNYFITGIGILGFVIISYKEYNKERKIEKIEEYFPDAFLSASGLPKGSKIDRVFSTIDRGYGELSSEAKISLRQLHSNVKPEKVIHDFWERNPSPMIKRACKLLEQSLNMNMLWILHNMAEDMLKSFEIKRERENLLGMQKYTLLAGGVLLPLILKTSLTLVEGMSGFLESDKGMLDMLYSAIPGYLVVYAILASYYLSDLEGKPSQSLIYFAGTAIVSILIFYFVNI